MIFSKNSSSQSLLQSISSPSTANDHVMAALNGCKAVIEFTPEGVIQNANENFLQAMGYRLSEIVGQHHRIFVDERDHRDPAYGQFWRDLAAGHFNQAEFKRVKKDGSSIWIEAIYIPIKNEEGEVYKVIKFASDITAEKMERADHTAQINAISSAQAVISFDVRGNILDANENFLATVGYSLSEIVGRHHSMFVEERYKNSQEYKDFWLSLAQGVTSSAQFKRFGKGGKEIWIQATYNPIFDVDGKAIKVVKYATDITERVREQQRFNTLSLVADRTSNGVIISDTKNHVEYVNSGFEKMTGYAFAELEGRDGSTFLAGKHTCQEALRQLAQKRDAQESFSGEVLYYHKNGDPFWVSLSINPIMNKSGVVERFIYIFVDITDSKLSSLNSHARLTAIEQNSIVFEWDQTNSLVKANELAIALMKVERFDELLNFPALDYNEFFSHEEQEVLKSGQSLEKTIRVQTAEQHELVLLATAQPLLGMEGELAQTVVYAADTTARNDGARMIDNVLQQINGIAGNISSISDQTNLLALNATIQSAKAGEAGKGFSVVATEVKGLAQNSASLSTEIANLVVQMRDKMKAIN